MIRYRENYSEPPCPLRQCFDERLHLWGWLQKKRSARSTRNMRVFLPALLPSVSPFALNFNWAAVHSLTAMSFLTSPKYFSSKFVVYSRNPRTDSCGAGATTMKLDIPDKTMRQKLERLLLAFLVTSVITLNAYQTWTS